MKHIQRLCSLWGVIALGILLSGCFSSGTSEPENTFDSYTRGIGIYPGKPQEDFAPRLVWEKGPRRNIAKLRKAYHSSSYDYNLTAQLLTDGFITPEFPAFIEVSTQAGTLQKNEREWLFDGKSDSKYRVSGDSVYLQLSLFHSDMPVDRIRIAGSVEYDEKQRKGYEVVCYGSNDGVQWTVLDEIRENGNPGSEKPVRRRIVTPPSDPKRPQPSMTYRWEEPRPTRLIDQTFSLKEKVDYAYYRLNFRMPSALEWSFSDWDFYAGDTQQLITPSRYFRSVWMSATGGEEWVYVDLGRSASFDEIRLHWIHKAREGCFQVSEDAMHWTDVGTLPGGTALLDIFKPDKPAQGRYVRVWMKHSSDGTPYQLSEMEVFGKEGWNFHPLPQKTAEGNTLYLSGGGWKLQRASAVKESGETISDAGYATKDWIPATVPGTVLSSYYRIGALPDPNFADNQLQISESFFNSNFWYRNEFALPADFAGGRVFLNFDGINWKANVFVNGRKIGRLEGAFQRGKWDVTDLLHPGKQNVLAVEILKNDHIGAIKEQTAFSPDQNGGILGADNPTFHASVGWDWIPTIRGRNIGIWNDVFLTHTGEVTLEDPFVQSQLPLPDTTVADIKMEINVVNHKDIPVKGFVKGKFGAVTFEKEIALAPYEIRTMTFDPSNVPDLKLQYPRLWWPNGYGEPYLYDVQISVEVDGRLSDTRSFRSGVRQMTFDEKDGVLTLFINGRRFIGRGGNWGFSESNLNYRSREYDIAVAYHADMHFTMIRNWVGQIGDEEFYEACDRYGILVWQDFWLANPVDGPNPYDPDMFMANAEDYVKRIRNHPSIGLYVGRNEGNPPASIDNALKERLPQWHPGIHYIPNSAGGVVSGGGPYRALPVRDYYLLRGFDKFHSERGMPNVMPYESLVQTLGEKNLWPQNSQWGLHDYTMAGAQAAASFNQMVEDAFGKPADAKQFTEWAQWINYNGYRGLFEGRSEYRKGLLLWMSHPAWPSMVWQTYDYYFEPTAAYFGCKKANEPLHIQWNPVSDAVEVVNYHAGNYTDLTVKAQLICQNGSVCWEKHSKIESREDSTVKCFGLEYPDELSPVYFIKLSLWEGERLLSDNFYWRGIEEGNYKALHQLEKVNLKKEIVVERDGYRWVIRCLLWNETSTPALMIRLKVKGDSSGDRILPVFYTDNYFSLMPGEKKEVIVTFKTEDCRGEQPEMEVSGFNL